MKREILVALLVVVACDDKPSLDDADAREGGWTLPAGFPESSLETLSDADGEDPVWSLIDLEGDGAPDLVVSRWDELGIPALGATEGLVYDSRCGSR